MVISENSKDSVGTRSRAILRADNFISVLKFSIAAQGFALIHNCEIGTLLLTIKYQNCKVCYS